MNPGSRYFIGNLYPILPLLHPTTSAIVPLKQLRNAPCRRPFLLSDWHACAAAFQTATQRQNVGDCWGLLGTVGDLCKMTSADFVTRSRTPCFSFSSKLISLSLSLYIFIKIEIPVLSLSLCILICSSKLISLAGSLSLSFCKFHQIDISLSLCL